jgi:hypothetical protein
MVQDLMGYAVKDWANNYDGIESEVDKANNTLTSRCQLQP